MTPELRSTTLAPAPNGWYVRLLAEGPTPAYTTVSLIGWEARVLADTDPATGRTTTRSEAVPLAWNHANSAAEDPRDWLEFFTITAPDEPLDLDALTAAWTLWEKTRA